MELTREQRSAVAGWAKGGAGLSEIQKRLDSELGIRMTYMDVRFLVLDLGLDIQERKSKSDKAAMAIDQPKGVEKDTVLPGDEDDGADESGAALQGAPGPAGSSGVSVSVDRLMVPGSLVSGSVVFSDGVKASWQIDQYGRLAITSAMAATHL